MTLPQLIWSIAFNVIVAFIAALLFCAIVLPLVLGGFNIVFGTTVELAKGPDSLMFRIIFAAFWLGFTLDDLGLPSMKIWRREWFRGKVQ